MVVIAREADGSLNQSCAEGVYQATVIHCSEFNRLPHTVGGSRSREPVNNGSAPWRASSLDCRGHAVTPVF
jgi:hypothetical protein